MSSTARPPILIVGATGRTGSAVVDELLNARVAIRTLTRRTPGEATLPEGIEVVTGDLAEPATLEPALHGVHTVFLVWTAPPATAPAVIEWLATHVRRVVFLSAPHQTPHPFFQQPNPMAALYADIEQRITRSGLEWTFIRPGMLASNALYWWAPTIRAGGTIRWPYAAAETAPIDDHDVAAVAAKILYEEGHIGGDYVLTGSEALSQAQQVRVIGDVLGRHIPFEEVTADEFRKDAEGSWPPAVVDMLLAAWGATIGTPAHVTTTVADILGTPARSFRHWVTDNAAAFTEGPAT